MALIVFGVGFFVFGVNAQAAENRPAKNYWKTYFSEVEATAVKKNAEKYVLSEIKKKSDAWKGIFSNFNIKKGSIDDQSVKAGGLGTDKIRDLDSILQTKISARGGALSGVLNWASNQTFSADNLTGAFAALDGSKITGLQASQISGLDSSLSDKLSTTGGTLGGTLNWATGQTFIADNLTGAYAALDGSKITGLTASQVGAVPYSGATGAVDLNGKNLVNLGNVGIGTTSPASLLSIGSDSGFQVNNTGTVISGTWAGNFASISTAQSSGYDIAAWGDSLTAGAGGTPYTTQLNTLLGGRNIYNAATGGG